MNTQNEWWIQKDIIPQGKNWTLNDDILLLLYEKFLSGERQIIESWHFFREPQLRFRIQLKNIENRNVVASEVDSFLDSINLVEKHYFANHERRVENLDEGYTGERETYKRMWPFQKKLWEWGSEMAVEAIKEFKETGTNDPSREFQLERVFHLLCNQLNPFSLNEVELYQRCANNRMLVWTSMRSLQLDKKLLEEIKGGKVA